MPTARRVLWTLQPSILLGSIALWIVLNLTP